MTTYAIYHWWSHPGEPPPCQNLRTPIIPSIATLRGVSDIPIIVMDMSQQDNDWADFPSKLQFSVVRRDFSLRWAKNHIKGWDYMSRVFDLFRLSNEIEENGTIIYVDSDVFWMKDPLPLARDPQFFCFDGWNSGLFYCRPSDNAQFFQIFDAYSKAAIFSNEIRNLMVKSHGYDQWYGVWDELILSFMVRIHPQLFSIIPREEHVVARTFKDVSPAKIKMFHANGTMVKNRMAKTPGEKIHCRGLIPLLFKEFFDNMSNSLGPEDLKQIYTPSELEMVPPRFSIKDQIDDLLNTKDESGHYHIMNMFSDSLL